MEIWTVLSVVARIATVMERLFVMTWNLDLMVQGIDAWKTKYEY